MVHSHCYCTPAIKFHYGPKINPYITPPPLPGTLYFFETELSLLEPHQGCDCPYTKFSNILPTKIMKRSASIFLKFLLSPFRVGNVIVC
jgi:hypothetical protein